jgi:hypothetical protein
MVDAAYLHLACEIRKNPIFLLKARFLWNSDLAKDQGRDPREHLESLIDWMRKRGYGPKN